MIIYKGLFQYRDKFSGSEAIIYSTLLCHSLWQYGEVFDSHGFFDIDIVKEFLEDIKDDEGYSYIDIVDFTCTKISKKLGMSERNVRYALKSLRRKKIIVDETILCPQWLLESGYLKIPENTTLKGWQLIFYTLLKNRSDYFGGSIDTFANRMAEMFHTTINNVYFLLHELKKKGYVARDAKNRLVIK